MFESSVPYFLFFNHCVRNIGSFGSTYCFYSILTFFVTLDELRSGGGSVREGREGGDGGRRGGRGGGGC